MERPDLTPSFRVKSSFSPRSFLWNTEITALWMLEGKNTQRYIQGSSILFKVHFTVVF